MGNVCGACVSLRYTMLRPGPRRIDSRQDTKRGTAGWAKSRTGRMNSPQQPHEVRLRGLHLWCTHGVRSARRTILPTSPRGTPTRREPRLASPPCPSGEPAALRSAANSASPAQPVLPASPRGTPTHRELRPAGPNLSFRRAPRGTLTCSEIRPAPRTCHSEGARAAPRPVTGPSSDRGIYPPAPGAPPRGTSRPCSPRRWTSRLSSGEFIRSWPPGLRVFAAAEPRTHPPGWKPRP
jgi:hypothetical protein